MCGYRKENETFRMLRKSINLKLGARKFFRTAENLFFVPRCSGCGERLLPYLTRPGSDCLCEKCYAEWNMAKQEICPECNREVFVCKCSVKGKFEGKLDGFSKLVFYRPGKLNTVNRIIYSLKYTDDCRLARFLSDELALRLADEFKARNILPDKCLYTFIPRRSKAISKYGFDQGERICKYIARVCGADCECMFVRTGGKEQKKLDAHKRAENISQHIKLKPRIYKMAEKYECVVLTDDVVTTGATLFAAQKLLKQAGFKNVILAAVGRTAESNEDKNQ